MSDFSNWSGVHRCSPVRRHMPATEAEVVQVLAEASARGERVKVVGAGHSWSSAACTDGHLMNLDRMNGVLEVDEVGCRVRVQAGMRLEDLNEALAERGLAMSNLGSISEQSAAGVISTGTHGTGVCFGSLSSMVESLRLVTASGEVMEIDAGQADLFSAARLSLGALGVITEVTFRCEPAFNLFEQAFGMPFEEACARMEALVDAYEHVKLWWLPHTDRVMVYAAERSARPANVGPGTGGLIRTMIESRLEAGRGAPVDLVAKVDDLVNEHLFDGVLRLGARVPALVPLINRAVSAGYFVDGTRIGRSDRIFNLAMPPVHREMEYGIPRQEAAPMFARLRSMIRDRGMKVNFIVELRFVAADDLMLSGAYGRESCQFGVYMAECPDLEAYFDGFEAMALAVGGRPHWGKEFAASSEALRAHLPLYDDFNDLRRAMDPEGRFGNAFLRQIFGE